MRTNLLKKTYHIFTGLIVFAFYYLTTSRSIGEIDSGELAAVQATWGIAHPTGYPLFSIFGYLYSKIPIVKPLIFQLNLFQAILNALTIVVLVKLIENLLFNFKIFISEKKHQFLRNIELNENTVFLTSVIGGLTFAFSITFWKQATRVEVYSLQIFITSIILYFLLRILINYLKSDEIRNSDWYTVAVLIGLAFSNHMMTLYLLPVTIYLFFLVNKFNKKSYFLFLQVFLISFSISFFFYLLMMLRAKSGPDYSFMNEPQSFSALIDYVRGKYYESKMFQGVNSIQQQSLQFLKILSFDNVTGFSGGEFGFLLIFVFSGLVFIFIFLHKLRAFYLWVILTSLFFVLNYSIPDIDEYFLVIFLLFSISSSIIIAVLFYLSNKLKFSLFLLILFLISFHVYNNYQKIDKSKDFVVEDYSKAVLGQLPKNSILLTSDWPLLAAPSYFLQYAEGYRNDVEVLGIEMLPLPSYKIDIKKKYGSIENLLKEDYYVTFDVFKDYIRIGKFKLGNKTVIPEGLCFKLSNDESYSDYYPEIPKIRFLPIRNIFQEYLYQVVGFMIETRVQYEIANNQIDKAKKLLNFIRTEYSEYKISNGLINLVD